VEKIARFLIGLAAFGVIGAAGFYGLTTADAQTGGGFPSQPAFQSVRVGSGLSIGAQGSLQTTGTIITSAGNLQASNGSARLNCSGVLSFPLTVCDSTHTQATLQINTDGGGTWNQAAVSLTDQGAGTLNMSQPLYVRNVIQPAVHSVNFGGAGSCSINYNPGLAASSCVRNSAGNYTVTWVANAFITAANLVCVGSSGLIAVPIVIPTSGGNTTTTTVQTYTTGAVLTDTGFIDLTCTG
jgi:hypothetical protein